MNYKTQSIYLFISKSINAIFNIVVFMILAKKLSIVDYANIRQFLTGNNLIVAIFSLGIPFSILYYLRENKDKNKNNIALSHFFIIIFAIICFLIIFSIPLSLILNLSFKTDFFSNNFFTFIIFLILLYIGYLSENILISLNKNINLIYLTTIPNLVFVIFIIYITSNGLNLYFILLGLIIKELIRVIILLVSIINEKISFHEINKSKLIEIVKFGIPIGISSIITILTINTDKIVTSIFLSKEEFALIANASYELPLLGIVGVSIFNVLVRPLKDFVKNEDNNSILKIWNKSGLIMITIVVPFVIPFIIFSSEVMTFLYSSYYASAKIAFSLYQINALSRIYIYSVIFASFNKPKIFAKNVLISFIINLLLNLFFVQYFGINGIAAASVISNILLIFLQLNALKNILKVKISKLFPFKEYVYSTVLVLLISIVFYVIYSKIFFTYNIIFLIFIIISFIFSFLVLSILVNNEILKLIYIKFKKVIGGK